MAVDSIISGGCIVSGGHVERSILSPMVRINSFSKVEDSILMDGVDVGEHSTIKRAIVDKRVKIPPHTKIGCDPEEDRRQYAVTEGGIAVITRHTLFPTGEGEMV